MGSLAVSLINKVLLDLDHRAQGRSAGRALFADVRPVGDAPSMRSDNARLRRVMLLGFSAVIIAVIAMAVLQRAWTWPRTADIPAPRVEVASAAMSPAPMTSPASTELTLASTPAVTAPPASPPQMPHQTGKTPLAAANPPVENRAQSKPMPTEAPREKAAAAPAMNNTARDDNAAATMHLERTARPLSAAEKAENQYRKAVSLLRGKRLDEAEQALRTALFIDPGHLAARETLVDMAIQNGNAQQAKQDLYEAMAVLPQQAGFVSRLARLYVDEGDETRALGLLEDNLPRTRPDGDYLGLLATLYQRDNRYAEARDHFRAALSFKPAEGRWWLGLGIAEWPLASESYAQAYRYSANEAPVRDYAEQRLSIVRRHLP